MSDKKTPKAPPSAPRILPERRTTVVPLTNRPGRRTQVDHLDYAERTVLHPSGPPPTPPKPKKGS